MTPAQVQHEIACLAPTGDLTGVAARALKARARALLAERPVVLDLSGVPFVDSEGLSTLVAVLKTALADARGLALCSVRSNVMELLRLTRLHRVFEIHPDRDSAVRGLTGDG